MRNDGVIAMLGIVALAASCKKSPEELRRSNAAVLRRGAQPAIKLATAMTHADLSANVPPCKGILSEPAVMTFTSIENIAGAKVPDPRPPRFAEPTLTANGSCYSDAHGCGVSIDRAFAQDDEPSSDYITATLCLGATSRVAVLRAVHWTAPHFSMTNLFVGGSVEASLFGFDASGTLVCRTPIRAASSPKVETYSGADNTERVETDLERNVRKAIADELGLRSTCKE